MGITIPLRMKVSSDVLWQLTKKNSAFIVQQKGAKSRGECFSKDPCNLTNMFNKSSQGYTEDLAYGLSAEKGPSKKGKAFRKVFNLTVRHKDTRNAKVWKKGRTMSGAGTSTMPMKRTANHAAKVIQKLPYANEKKKALMLKRLGKLNAALTYK